MEKLRIKDAYLEKRIKIAFDDGRGIAIRIGILKGLNEGMFILETVNGLETINKDKVVRIEEVNG